MSELSCQIRRKIVVNPSGHRFSFRSSKVGMDKCFTDGKFDDSEVNKEVHEVFLISFSTAVTYSQVIEILDSMGYKPVPFSVFMDFVSQNGSEVGFASELEDIQASNQKPEIVSLSPLCEDCKGKKCLPSFYRNIDGPYVFRVCVESVSENGKQEETLFKNYEYSCFCFLVMKK